MTYHERKIRVFLVDDHEVVRAGVRHYIGDIVDVVGEADEADAAIELICERQPDVVLLDVHLPGGGGRRVLEVVHAQYPDIVFLALTVSEKPEDVMAIIRGGARGYLTKDVLGFDLVDQIRAVYEGGAVVSPQLAAFAVQAFDEEGPQDLDPEIDLLTESEKAVAILIAKGYTNKQIAAVRVGSIKTVEKHVSSILRKLTLTNRTQVTRWVLSHPTMTGTME